MTLLVMVGFMYPYPTFVDDEIDDEKSFYESKSDYPDDDEDPWWLPTWKPRRHDVDDTPGDTSEYDEWCRKAYANPPHLVLPKY